MISPFSDRSVSGLLLAFKNSVLSACYVGHGLPEAAHTIDANRA